MNEEEKEAIEIFKKLVNYLEKWNTEYTIVNEDKKYFKTVLNLISKQQKEIEDLKQNCISKTKIKDKIEELKREKEKGHYFEIPDTIDEFYDDVIDIIKELLEEE